MTTISTNPFLDCLRKSGLFEEDKLDAVLQRFSGDAASSESTAEFLVSQKFLTAFQASVLLAGKHKGLIMGPYRILDKIGSGGMGIVYLAEHEKLSRQVAIKILPEEKTKDKLSLERFYREARAAAALDHPNIVKAYDINEYEGVHYLVMEYINGGNLQKYLIKKDAIPWKTAVNIVIQACKGLQHAHERNLVHRDIKPANLLIDKVGHVKILDLGLARSFEKANDNLTEVLSNGKDVMGSIDYISPEQSIGKTTIDIRADIYSLGATLYTLITRLPPVHGTPAQKLLQHQMKQPPAVHKVKPDTPKALSQIIIKMMAKNPDDRYATPADVEHALTPLVNSSSKQLPLRETQFNVAAMPPPVRRRSSMGFAPPRSHTPMVMDAESSTATKVVEKARTQKVKPRKVKKKKRDAFPLMMVGVCALFLVVVPIVVFIYFLKSSGKAEVPVIADKPIGAPSLTSSPANSPAPEPEKKAAAGPSGIETSLSEGQKLPDIVGEDLNNTNFRLSDYDGKVILLDFWGFWCPHCVKMIPHERSLVEQYQNRPFVLLGVNNDKDSQTLSRGLQSHRVNWRSFKNVLPDGEQLSKKFGVKGFPTLFLIDHQGIVRKIWVGSPSTQELDQMIETYVKLAEKNK